MSSDGHMIQELHSFTKRTVAEHSLLMSLDANMMKELCQFVSSDGHMVAEYSRLISVAGWIMQRLS